MWRMNLAILISQAGGVAFAVKVPGRNHKAVRTPAMRKSTHKKNSHLIRLSMGSLYKSVYLVGDFRYKPDLVKGA
jgi:hypothetical protein